MPTPRPSSPPPSGGGLVRRSKGLVATLLALLFAMLALASFAGALEARTTNAMEAARRDETCEPGDVTDWCVDEPVAPHVLRGLGLAAASAAGAAAARRVRTRPEGT